MTQAIISGILVGGVYGLVAMGFSLVFGVMRIVNFAHGDLLMVSMYVAFVAATATGLDPLVILPIACLVMALVGVVLYLGVFRYFVGRATLGQFLVAIAVSMILQMIVQLTFGPDTHSFRSTWGSKFLLFGQYFFSYAQIAAFGVAVVCVIVLEILLRATRWGHSIRAIADDPEAAEIVGLDTTLLNIGAFVLSCVLAAIAGTVLLNYYPFSPTTGFALMPLIAIATIIGGLGSIFGAFIGGIACGVITEIFGYTTSPALQEVPLYVLLLLFLAFRPYGMFGRKAGH